MTSNFITSSEIIFTNSAVSHIISSMEVCCSCCSKTTNLACSNTTMAWQCSPVHKYTCVSTYAIVNALYSSHVHAYMLYHAYMLATLVMCMQACLHIISWYLAHNIICATMFMIPNASIDVYLVHNTICMYQCLHDHVHIYYHFLISGEVCAHLIIHIILFMLIFRICLISWY